MNGKFEKSVSLIACAFNEEESIADFFQKAIEVLDGAVEEYEIVLINDGSTDSTLAIANSFATKNPNVKVYSNDQNMNIGYSYRRAISLASKEYVFSQTVDWSYDISKLRDHLEYLQTYDIVQGTRRAPVVTNIEFLKPILFLKNVLGMQHLTRRSDTVGKAIVSLCNYVLIRFLFRIPLSDFQNVTIYPTRWRQELHYESMSSFANPEGLIKAYWAGKSIKEVEINFVARTKGQAKGTKIKSIITSVIEIFYFWFKWVIYERRHHTNKGRIFRLSIAETV